VSRSKLLRAWALMRVSRRRHLLGRFTISTLDTHTAMWSCVNCEALFPGWEPGLTGDEPWPLHTGLCPKRGGLT
jgi:hypothetical protein